MKNISGVVEQPESGDKLEGVTLLPRIIADVTSAQSKQVGCIVNVQGQPGKLNSLNVKLQLSGSRQMAPVAVVPIEERNFRRQ